MSGSFTRRQIFGKALHGGKRLLAQASGAVGDNDDRNPGSWRDTQSMSGDFSPELLAMEAERLGLDSGKMDREELLAEIYRAMQPPAPNPGPGGDE